MTYSLDLREKVISFISDGGSKSEAMRIFQLSRDTIYRWINAEDLRPKEHGQRHRKIDKEALRKHVEEYSPDFNPIEQTFGAMKKRRQGMPQETNIENLILSYY